jgi:uncharacterized protein (DUF58 family)
LAKYFRALKFRSNSSLGGVRTTKSPRRILPFSVRITREGIIYLAGILVLSLIAINTANNLLFIILAALLAMIAVSGIVSRNSLKQVALSLQLPENVFAGERVSIKVSIKNLKRIFPSFSIRVEDPEISKSRSPYSRLRKLLTHLPEISQSPEENRTMLRQAAYFPFLRAGETRSELAVQSFPKRGVYNLDGFWISTRFPFGFFRRGERIGAKGEVLVYPLTQQISSFFHLLPFLPGNLEGHHAGQGENLLSIRKYEDSESARLIDWKATAKTGELMVREHARDEESKFCLILDTRLAEASTPELEERFEKAVSLAASISAHFLEQGAGIEFLTPHEYVPRGTGADHLYRILRSLAVVRYHTGPLNGTPPWRPASFSIAGENPVVQEILSDKVFKIVITAQPRGSFPSAIWRSSHVVFFDEL